MALVVLLEASPADPITGLAVPVRIAGAGSINRPYAHKGFSDWRAGLATLPRFRTEIGFDGNGWTGQAVPQTAVMRVFSADQAYTDTLAGLFWNQAPVTITTFDDQVSSPVYTTAVAGVVSQITVDTGVITITLGGLAVMLDKPMLTKTFAGTGGLEGPVDIAARVKRRSFGVVFNVEGLILDKANSIYEFGDPAFAAAQFVRVKDKGREGPITLLAPQASAAATFAALQAATAPVGGGVVAPSIQCVKWWTTASGPLTADMIGEGESATVPALVAAIVGAFSSIPVDGVAAAAALRPGVAGIHISDDNESVANALDRLTLGASLIWTMTPAGRIEFRQWRRAFIGQAAGWINAPGAAWANAAGGRWRSFVPGVSLVARASKRLATYQPIRSREVGYQRNHRVHSDAEVSAAILATDVNYPDGTPVSALQPVEGGADVTAKSQIVVDTTRSVTLAADYQGTISQAMFPVIIGVNVTKGGSTIRTDDATTYLVQTSNVTASVDNTSGSPTKGTISITAVSANTGYIDLSTTVAGVVQPAIRITVAKNIAAAPNTGTPTAKQASDTSFNEVSGTDFVAITDTLNIAVATGERIIATAPLDYYVQGTTQAQRQASAKWQYATSANGPWTDFAPAITGSTASSGYNSGRRDVYDADAGYVDPQPGHGDFNHALTGLGAGAYYVRLIARLNATGRTVTFEGTANIQAAP